MFVFNQLLRGLPSNIHYSSPSCFGRKCNVFRRAAQKSASFHELAGKPLSLFSSEAILLEKGARWWIWFRMASATATNCLRRTKNKQDQDIVVDGRIRQAGRKGPNAFPKWVALMLS